MNARYGRSGALGLAALLSLAGCGRAVGRVPFAAEGSATGTATLAAGDVAFWADLDIEYEGDTSLSYAIELEQGGKVVATATCNPLGRMTAKVGWIETNLGGAHSRSGQGKMTCSATVPAAGPTDVKVTLAFGGDQPKGLKLARADLVLKQ